MLVEFNKNAAYRAQTERMANSPRDTFVCAFCGGYKSILGRKAMPSPGKRRIWKCAQCAGVAK